MFEEGLLGVPSSLLSSSAISDHSFSCIADFYRYFRLCEPVYCAVDTLPHFFREYSYLFLYFGQFFTSSIKELVSGRERRSPVYHLYHRKKIVWTGYPLVSRSHVSLGVAVHPLLDGCWLLVNLIGYLRGYYIIKRTVQVIHVRTLLVANSKGDKTNGP